MKKLFKKVADAICRKLVELGARHFRGAVVDVHLGDDLYVLKKYWPKHDIKVAADKTPETPRAKRVTKLNSPEFWAEKSAQYNSPGYADFMVLDCWEKKLP